MKTAFQFCLRLCRLRSAHDLVKARLSESEAEAEELHQSQIAGTCIVIGLLVCRKKRRRSDSSDSDSVALVSPLTTPIFYFHWVLSAFTTPLTTPTRIFFLNQVSVAKKF